VETKDAATNSQIDPASAESFIAEKRIGERIKRLRLKKSMGLVELGRHTGLSASFLSQLETGRVVPTLRNLARVASRTPFSVFIGRKSAFVCPRLASTTQPTTSRAWDTWFPIGNWTPTTQSLFR
jgi:transcriptional regulator with XRE-family HTH domain